MTLSKPQKFALWYMLENESRYSVADGYPEDYPSRYVMGGGGIREATLRALEKRELVQGFQSTHQRKLERRGQGVVNYGYTKTEKVTRWKLTDKGREIAGTIESGSWLSGV